MARRQSALAIAGANDALADSELGTAIKECELAEAVADRLSLPTGNPLDLSDSVRARFGRDAFKANTRLVIRRLKEAA